ncbi:hypothetical protein OAK91_02915 [Planctomycetaceae bacterium]|nr:hypothetical protein [Planctomycetaceae bacterium]
MAESTTLTSSEKAPRPEKPYPEFPLYAHACGSWVKKINGKRWTFGGWKTDPQGEKALVEYHRQKDYIESHGERPPEPKTQIEVQNEIVLSQQEGPGLTVHYLVNRYLAKLDRDVDNGRRSYRHFSEMKRRAKEIKSFFGGDKVVAEITAQDFRKLLESWEDRKLKAKSIEGYVTRARAIFSWGYSAGLMPTPVRFNGSFQKPPKEEILRERNQNRRQRGGKAFSREEIRLMLDAAEGKEVTLLEPDPETGKPVTVNMTADPCLRAMILLGINCGLGNEDVSELSAELLDLDTGWLDFPRNKTGRERLSKAWPETISAVKEAIAARPQPKYREDKDRFFLTTSGLPVCRSSDNRTPIDGIVTPFSEFQKALGIYRTGRGFYGLRHSFKTTASMLAPKKVVDIAAGHSFGGIDENYVDATAPEWRPMLEDLSQKLHGWLWPDAG